MNIRAQETGYPLARTTALVTGDVLTLLIFAAIGRRSHGEAVGLEAMLEVVTTGLPFIAGWLLIAPWTGAFKPEATRSPFGMLRATLLGWCGGLLVGALLRAAMLGRFSPVSFYLVTFAVALFMLSGWRSLFLLLETRRRAA